MAHFDQGSTHQLCQATGSFSFTFTLPGQPFSSDSQTKMSLFSSFTSYKNWHTKVCLVQEQVTRGISSMWKKLQAEGNDVCNVLPAYTLSQLRHKQALLLGRVKQLIYSYCWYPWCFLSLGRSFDMPSHVEHFVCMLYNSTTTIWTFCVMQSLRKDSSQDQEVDISLLPPCKNALNMYKES